jgi:hypothetical protein
MKRMIAILALTLSAGLAHAETKDAVVSNLHADCLDGLMVQVNGTYLCRKPQVTFNVTNGRFSSNYVAVMTVQGSDADATSLKGFCVAMGLSDSDGLPMRINWSDAKGINMFPGANGSIIMNEDGSVKDSSVLDFGSNPTIAEEITCK